MNGVEATARSVDGLTVGEDGRARCAWCVGDPEYMTYHDHEWGLPTHDDIALFEKLCLEGFQAGLSWLTILRKRPAFRAAFAGFDPEVVATYGERDVRRLLEDTGIVRHRGKIEAAIGNARVYLEVVASEGSLDALVWRFAPVATPTPRRLDDIPAATRESAALARELKRRGWRFIGPTTVYAFMQSMGLVDDHLVGCHARRAPA